MRRSKKTKKKFTVTFLHVLHYSVGFYTLNDTVRPVDVIMKF